MSGCVFTIPIPPPLNGVYANRKGGRRKTKAYLMWRSGAVHRLIHQGVPSFSEQVVVDISIPKQRGDIDNRIKTTLDAMQEAGVLENDSLVTEVRCRWIAKGGDEARVSVRAL